MRAEPAESFRDAKKVRRRVAPEAANGPGKSGSVLNANRFPPECNRVVTGVAFISIDRLNRKPFRVSSSSVSGFGSQLTCGPSPAAQRSNREDCRLSSLRLYASTGASSGAENVARASDEASSPAAGSSAKPDEPDASPSARCRLPLPKSEDSTGKMMTVHWRFDSASGSSPTAVTIPPAPVNMPAAESNVEVGAQLEAADAGLIVRYCVDGVSNVSNPTVRNGFRFRATDPRVVIALRFEPVRRPWRHRRRYFHTNTRKRCSFR